MSRLKETAQQGNTYPQPWDLPQQGNAYPQPWDLPQRGNTYPQPLDLPQRGNTYPQPWDCPNGATHTSPGCNPGTRIREKRCVLKERRIGSAVVEVRGAEICGVPSERGFLYPGGFPGFAPWAGMRCPFRAWDRERGAMPRWWHGIGNVVLAWDRNAIVLNF
jgi:hypothetical protein